MKEVIVIKKEKIKNGWKFSVRVEEKKYSVELTEDYWKQLTGTSATPEKLVEQSFSFLLMREPKESILPTFNLKQIQSYFSDYEEKIKSMYK
ncbi:hypothetical protein IIB50_01160 [Patescibacteria group bacterium]|nr:hypothetical protein [Patescibacteria group bacterium]